MTRAIVHKLYAMSAVFALVVLVSASCSRQTDLQTSGEGVADKQPVKPQDDSSTPRHEGQEAADNDTPQQVADAVYRNGKIYTVNEKLPWAEAVAVKNGKFIKVGSADDVKALIGNDTEVVDLAGNMVMPGILDLHSHPFITPWYGQMNLSLKNPGDPKKILEEVKAYADANPDKEWILAGQWNIGIYPDNAPKKEWLDEIVPDRPVVLLDQSGHSSWLNSKALELAGITKDTPTSNLIVIVKDETTGEPTGTIREQALQLAERVIPQATPEQYGKPIEEIFDMFLSYGITTQQSAEGHRAPLEALKLLESQGRLKQRVFVSWDWKTTLNLAYTLDDIEGQIKDRAKYESEMVRPNYVKIFSDGSPGDRTSLLLSHYVGEPDFLGQANMSTEEFAEAFIKFDKMGVGVHVHSIGEGSIRRVVDALELMKEANGDSGVRHKIAHCWMITPEDIARLAKMKDVNIDFSPHIPYPHVGVSALYPPRIGDERYSKMFPVKTAIDAGLHVGQGADWLTANPTPNPFPAIEGFVTRMNPDDPSMGTLNPSEAISLEQAIRVCTLEGAWVLGAEDELGSVEEGKFADMIVLDQNLFDLEKAERLDRIGDTHVLKTIVGGQVVYDAMAQADDDEHAANDIKADAVYTNGKIYTVNEKQPWAEAVALKDGKFIKVGSAEDVKPLIGEDTEVVDLKGGFAMPGIGDSHIHPALLMHKRAFCALPGTFEDPTEEQIIAKLKEAIADYPKDKEWFIGHGFTTPALSKETLTREFLDKLIPDRPAWIEDESGHTGWLNTKAMEAAGVTKDFKDTPEEFFSRTEDGDLAGVAYEGAMNPFLDALPPFDTSIKKIGFARLMEEALSKGITAFGDGYVFEQDLRAYHELYFEGKIRQHVVLYLKGNLGTPQLTPIETLEEWWSKYKLPGRKAVKLGMGGALESRSEALVDGYAPESKATVDESLIPGDQVDETEENSGGNARPVIPAEQFAEYMAKLDEAGFQVKVHAIGDGAVRATIDGYEKVIKANGDNRLRHHIDHCSLVHPDDYQRLVDLDISVTLWSVLNAPLQYNLQNIKPVLKPETWKRMYANRERVDAGIRIVQHTDAPAAVLWPWWGMEAAITRAIPGKPEAGKLGEEHALTLEEVIKAYTINVAWSLHYDDVTGSIEEGKFADMIILNHNLFDIPVTDIHKTEVQQTLFKGIVVYDASTKAQK